jgi:ABC-2 type transport system permease protein
VRNAWYVTTKELLENRRDWLAALFTIFLPVVFTIFLGMILGGAESGTFPLAVADADGSAAAQRLVEELDTSPLLDLKEMDVAEVDDAVQDQKVAAALVIPEGFGAAVEAGASSPLTFIRVETSSGAQSVQQAVGVAVSELNVSILVTRTVAEQVSAETGASLDDSLIARASSLADAQLATPIVTAAVIDAGRSNAVHAGGFDQSSTGGLVNWVLFGILGIAATTVWERRRGLLRRLSVAGVSAPEIIGGKMLAMVIVTFLQQLLLVIVGEFALGVDYFSSPLALVITMVSLSGLAATFGLLISVLFRSEQAVVATTVVSAQLLAALGGAWFPLEVTGAGFSRIAHVLPSAWIMDSLHGIVLQGWGVGDVLLPLGIVWAWIVAIFALAVWRYRPD